MYFIGKLYRGTKTAAATLGLIGSGLAIVYGALQTGGTIYVVGGCLCLANSLFNLGETGKVIDDIKEQIENLKNNLDKFTKENHNLQQNVSDLAEIKDQFIDENRKLHQTIEESIERINRLEHLKTELTQSLKAGNEQVIVLEDHNSQLQESVEEFKGENIELQHLLEAASHQLKEIEKVKNVYELENSKLTANNTILTEQLEKQMKIIEESKKLIHSLAQFGDTYNQFSSSIDTNLVKLETTGSSLDETATILSNLVEKLKQQTFEQLDADGDGNISRLEFEQGLT